MANPIEHLPEDERRLLEAWRNARSSSASTPLPRLSMRAFRDRMKTRLGLSDVTSQATIERFGLTTQRHDGPLVNVTGTLDELIASWRAHEDDLILRGRSGHVLRHRREAITRYCKCAGIGWTPDTSVYERRSREARERATRMIQLPEDWLDRVHAVIHHKYHKDPAVNAMYRYRVRLAFRTAPRVPSEDSRLRLRDIHWTRGVITYRSSKASGPEGDAVLIPRDVFDLPASVLTAPKRYSLQNYIQVWRPKLVRRYMHATGARDHGFVWAGPDGSPMDPRKFRVHLGSEGRKAWPDFYPYLTREIGIIAKALETILERGSLDYELLTAWTGHEKIETARHYTRKAKQLLAEAGGRPEDLRTIVARWRDI